MSSTKETVLSLVRHLGQDFKEGETDEIRLRKIQANLTLSNIGFLLESYFDGLLDQDFLKSIEKDK